MVLYSEEARRELKLGVDLLANAVKVTLGPKGRNVVISNPGYDPFITKDGVTVAKNVCIKDSIESVGVELLKRVAIKTASDSGDGTTSATVLAQSMISRGIDVLRSKNVNSVQVKKGMDIALEKIVSLLKRYSEPVGIKTNSLVSIATISANNDSEIGNIVSKAIENVNRIGAVIVDINEHSSVTTLRTTKGVKFNRGYISPYFVKDRLSEEIVLDNVSILLYDGKVNSVNDVISVIDKCSKSFCPLVIIADDFSNDFIKTLVVNFVNKNLLVFPVKCPGFGELRMEWLNDLSLIVNTAIVSKSSGVSIDSVLDSLGFVDRVIIGKDDTTIISNSDHSPKLKVAIMDLKQELKSNDITYVSKIRDRISRLNGSVSTIEVGAKSEVEAREIKDRVDDAVCATKAAIDEGVVEGGGITFLKIFNELSIDKSFDKDIILGFNIVKESLKSPITQICLNAGVNPNVVISNVLNSRNGYNALSGNYENFKKAGIIDPVKVLRVCIENAVSVSSMILTTECLINNE